MELSTDCELCNAVQNSGSSEALVYNTILYETENFLITPCIGPLVEGQIMIVSKDHYPSLAAMNDTKRKECQELFEMIFKMYDDKVLLTEHGSFSQLKGGACIEHTHIHVVPGFSNLYNKLDGILELYHKVTSKESLYLLKTVDFPYILNITNGDEIRVYYAYGVHSQMMRKVICQDMGKQQNCDWRQNENLDLIKKTILKWNLLQK